MEMLNHSTRLDKVLDRGKGYRASPVFKLFIPVGRSGDRREGAGVEEGGCTRTRGLRGASGIRAERLGRSDRGVEGLSQRVPRLGPDRLPDGHMRLP